MGRTTRLLFKVGGMKRIVASALLFLLTTLPAVAAVYKWTDENGLVHFSDEPHPGAERLNVGQPAVYSPPPVHSPPPINLQSGQKATSTVTGYGDFGIVQPRPGATIRNNPGTIIVRFGIEPELRQDDHIRVLLDGQSVDTGPSTATTVELHRVNRGTHTLSAVIEDKAGKVLARASPVTFYMHRPSVNIPANKPPR